MSEVELKITLREPAEPPADILADAQRAANGRGRAVWLCQHLENGRWAVFVWRPREGSEWAMRRRVDPSMPDRRAA